MGKKIKKNSCKKIHLLVKPFSLKNMLNISKYMEWEKCTIDPKIALITNSFGHKLSNNERKEHAKNYVSKCKSVRPTVKRISKNRRPSILARTLEVNVLSLLHSKWPLYEGFQIK